MKLQSDGSKALAGTTRKKPNRGCWPRQTVRFRVREIELQRSCRRSRASTRSGIRGTTAYSPTGSSDVRPRSETQPEFSDQPQTVGVGVAAAAATAAGTVGGTSTGVSFPRDDRRSAWAEMKRAFGCENMTSPDSGLCGRSHEEGGEFAPVARGCKGSGLKEMSATKVIPWDWRPWDVRRRTARFRR